MISRTLQHIADLGYHARYLRLAAEQAHRLRLQGLYPSPRARREAAAYARDVLGGWYFTAWLINYSAVRGEFVEGWIPDNFYGGLVVPHINRPLGLAGAKTFAWRVLPAGVLPDLGYLIDHRLYGADMARLTPTQAADLFFDQHEQIVVKGEYGRSGAQVQRIDRSGWDGDAVVKRPGRHVIQRYIRQHSAFDGYCDGGATVRLTSVRELDGTFSVRAAYIRLPGPGEATVRSKTAFRLAVTTSTGAASQDARLDSWQRFTNHPLSGARFQDLQLPGYTAATQMVLDAHHSLPQFGCIGWDVLIDRDERPWLLEWNVHHNGVAFSEAANGPHFRGLNWEALRPRRGVPISPVTT